MRTQRLEYSLFSIFILGLLVTSLWGWIPGAAGAARQIEASPQKQADFPDVQAVASYTIDVSLDPETKGLAGRERITFVNTSNTPIPDLVFHLYLNAFRDENSIFNQEGGEHRMLSWDPQNPGWIEVSSLSVEGGPELALTPVEDGTLARAELPEALEPGETLVLNLEFSAQLPRVFARTGFAEDAQGDPFFMVGQWFPKLGVWEDGAWNAYPFHANAEFYADFGTYDVAITVPEAYQTAATGLRGESQANGDGTQTTFYHAEGVIDFAWAASPNFKEASRDVEGIELVYVYLPEHEWTVERALDAAEGALRAFGEWYGPYAYPRLTVVDVPDEGSGAGGMEYPMLVTAGVVDAFGLGTWTARMGIDRTMELVVAHEVGHQWWQTMVAFNEAEEPWLDEGLTDFSTARLYAEGDEAFPFQMQVGEMGVSPLQFRRLEYVMNPRVPSSGRAWDFPTFLDYGIATYSKPVVSLTTLENVLGEEVMLEILSTFFERYQFAHPGEAELRAVAEEVSGQELSWFFDDLIGSAGVVNYSVTALESSSVTVQRQGDLAIPVEVLVTFADGSQVTESWDGAGQSVTFSYPERGDVRSALVDPQQKLAVDLNWMDNGLRRNVQPEPWAAFLARILFSLQDWLLALGGL